ncbi:sugar phosphate isomerase/epimerase family protein [Saliphagus infecundisoli]|uniref:Sugar phosphate isomerase/epimerase family protein n=1 Tax=Saliphagus infecundisoli TaxID=1849069 RepID=A0ABD5QA33_9EURY|nr:sugar phosphate isomerase/epimerase [Saliphagus infecundisoli]
MTHSNDVSVQSVVFAERSLEEVLAAVERVGVDSLELWGRHLSPDDTEARIADGLAAIEDADATVRGHGVVDLSEPADVEEHVAFADRLGADYLTVNYPPDQDELTEELIARGEEYGIDVAIHNYSTVHHDDLSAVFVSIGDVRAVLSRYDHPRLGVCIDTGHFLVMDETPGEAIPEFGDRIVATHLKDVSEAELEDVPGAGELDLPSILGLLADHAPDAPLVIEYELPDDRAEEALAEAVENLRAARSGE